MPGSDIKVRFLYLEIDLPEPMTTNMNKNKTALGTGDFFAFLSIASGTFPRLNMFF